MINKIGIAEAVGCDANWKRLGRPFRFCSLRTGEGVEELVAEVRRLGGL